MKKYFNWKFINSPPGHRLLLLLALAGLVIWYVFKKVPGDKRFEALIEQQRNEIQQLEKQNKDEADYREFMRNSIDGITRKLNEKDKETIKIYERIRTETKYLDSLTVPDMQEWFNARTKEGNP